MLPSVGSMRINVVEDDGDVICGDKRICGEDEVRVSISRRYPVVCSRVASSFDNVFSSPAGSSFALS